MDVVAQFANRSGAVVSKRLPAAMLLLVLWAISAVVSPSRAAEQYSEDAVKAAFLYRFAGYVDWPDEALASPNFTIAVLGAEGVASELQQLLPNHPLKNRPTQVRKIASVKELGDAQVLFVGPAQADNARAAIAALAMRPVLVVTDEERGLENGSTVNFLVVDRRIRFEISLIAAERSGLKISSDMLSVAARVQGGRLRSDASCTPLGGTRELGAVCAVRMTMLARAGSVAAAMKNLHLSRVQQW